SEFKSVLAKSKSLDIPPTLDSRHVAIKLRGSCSAVEMEKGKALLKKLMEKATPPCLRKDDMSAPVHPKTRAGFQQQVSIHLQPEILPLDPVADAESLRTWNKCLLPALPGIFKGVSVGGSYSAPSFSRVEIAAAARSFDSTVRTIRTTFHGKSSDKT
ncbi:uncharacterized protein BDR25DRAFT_370910, partial [Lindgomyces ingoldianus]